MSSENSPTAGQPSEAGPAAPPAATVRLFVALAPPDDAKNELERALGPVYAAHPLLRWNRIEDWHITLAFLGELPAEVVPGLRTALAAVAAGHVAPGLELVGAGHFDDRVLWSGLRGDLERLHRIAAAVRQAVAACGLPFADRPLRPHLTLARARRGNVDGIPQAAAELAGFAGRRWTAERLHLVGSNYGRGPGPIHYRDIDAWPLGAADG